MNVVMARWAAADGWTFEGPVDGLKPDWILYFGATSCLEDPREPVREMQRRFPGAICSGCSTAGEISGDHVEDDAIVAVLVRFSQVRLRAAAGVLKGEGQSQSVGRTVAGQLVAADLRHVLVLSDGLLINGTQLVAGFREALPEHVMLTGGLAGDGTRFGRTLSGLGPQVRSGQVVALGFYGAALRVGYGSAGGWESFGPRRLITKAAGNVLYELDGQPALALYKRYLGERAEGLPATGLLFPLELLPDATASSGLVRTILAVDESAQSLTFAGDMPQGQYARLMSASQQGIVAGAERPRLARL